MRTTDELIRIVVERLVRTLLEREPKPAPDELPEPEPEPEFDGPRPHPMIAINKRIRAEKLRQFRAQIKRRPV